MYVYIYIYLFIYLFVCLFVCFLYLQEKICWFVEENTNDILSCITHTEDLQLWTSDGVSPFLQFSRDKICHSMQVKYSFYLYSHYV